jgi:hypothetical protein
VEAGLQVPAAVMTQFQSCFFFNMSEKERKARILAEAIDYFQQRSIAVMFIKGIALDVLIYDHPYYVMSEDIDIVLSVKAEDLTGTQVQDIMYRLHNLGIEYDFFEHHDTTMNGVLPIDFRQIWQNARKIEFRGREVWVMSPEDILISTCINSCRKRFFKRTAVCQLRLAPDAAQICVGPSAGVSQIKNVRVLGEGADCGSAVSFPPTVQTME